MLIRCDRCSTLYELDEALLAPEGSPVQCTRCDHVFTARPASGPSHEPPPPAEPWRPEPPPPPEDDELPEPPPPMDDELPEPAAVSSPASYSTPPLRWDRPGPPVYRPSAAPSAPGVTRPPQIRRDAVGAFEARLRRSARWRWLAPALVVLALAAIVAAWLLLSRRQGPVSARLHAEGLALMALDDQGSLEQAVARLDEALRSAPKRREAEADRALAEVLRGTALLEDGAATAARAAAAQRAEQAAAAAEALADEGTGARPPAADPAAADAAPPPVSAETARLQAEARALVDRGTGLSRSALGTLQRLEGARVAELEVARALALHHAALGEREAAARYVAVGRAKAADDPWLALAEATVDLGAPDRAGRERTIAALSSLASGHPELLRARYLLAVAQAGLGRRAEAQVLADAILAANPRHERAEALRAELARPPIPPAPPIAAPAAAGGPGATAGNPGAAQRKPASHAAAPPAPAAPVTGTPSAGGASANHLAPAENPSAAPRAGRPGAGARAHDRGSVAGPSGRTGAASFEAAPRPGPAAPSSGAPVLPPRPRSAPEARPVEYGGGE